MIPRTVHFTIGDDVDPAIMAGEEWIHPTNDIGWISEENQELLKRRR